jgi:MFS family permease
LPLIRAVHTPGRIVALVCVAEIVGMATFSMFLAIQPVLQREWSLSNTTSGWIASAYYGGYMIAVPVLASLTDRLDARTVWLGAITLAAAGALGFGMLASDPVSAVVWQAVAGAGLAGTYMPGLKVMADRIPGVLHPRLVAFYTTSFSLGSSGSYFFVGQLVERFPWRIAVAAAAIGPAVGWLLVYFGLARVRPHAPREPAESAARWRDVLRSAESMRYVAAYSCHMWELFGMRAWLVPFLVFCATLQGPTFAAPTTLAAILALAGIPGSFLGAELSARFGRRSVVITLMVLSAITGTVVGLLVSQSWALILTVSTLHHALVMSDSAALTSGLVTVSPPHSRGTAMAVYSMAGFGTASVASFAIGGVLDIAGGQSVVSWPLAFAVMVSSNILGAVLLARAR